MLVGDELLVSVNDGAWGNAARNEMMARAERDACCLIDDDDVYVDGALQAIREAVAQSPLAMHIFRMRYADGSVLWRTPELALGNIGTPMIVVPRQSFGHFGDRYEGDFDFAYSTAQLVGEPIFHDRVIALIDP
jgi:glycosyltransferase involved in cell wall biosynthesis